MSKTVLPLLLALFALCSADTASAQDVETINLGISRITAGSVGTFTCSMTVTTDKAATDVSLVVLFPPGVRPTGRPTDCDLTSTPGAIKCTIPSLARSLSRSFTGTPVPVAPFKTECSAFIMSNSLPDSDLTNNAMTSPARPALEAL